MLRWPSTTPGSVSTSTSRSAARWCSAKLRTCSWAKRMSSMSWAESSAMQAWISASVRRKSSRSQPSNLAESSRTAAIAALRDVGEEALHGGADSGVGFALAGRRGGGLEVSCHPSVPSRPSPS